MYVLRKYYNFQGSLLLNEIEPKEKTKESTAYSLYCSFCYRAPSFEPKRLDTQNIYRMHVATAIVTKVKRQH